MPHNVKCTLCGKPHYKRPSRLKKLGGKSFCSSECYNEWKKKQNPEAYFKCSFCGKDFRTNPAYIKRRPKQTNWFCSNECYQSFLRSGAGMELNKRKSPYNGTSCSKERYHRYLMEQHLGRKLLSTEVIHHIDGDKKNNSLDNLMVMDRLEHLSLHAKKYWEDNSIRYKCGMDNLTILEWSKRTGLNEGTIRSRIRMGWDIKDVLNRPLGKNHGRDKNNE